MSFLVLLALIVTLFYLTFNSGFNCTETEIEGLCVLTEEYEGFTALIIIEVGFIAVFLILASYFQQYFMIDNKKEKVKVKKEKKRYTSIKAPKPLEEYVSPDLEKKEEKREPVKPTPIGVSVASASLEEVKFAEPIEKTKPKPEPVKEEPLKTIEENVQEETVKPSLLKEEADELEQELLKQEQLEKERKKAKRQKLFKIKPKRGLELYEAPSNDDDEIETSKDESNDQSKSKQVVRPISETSEDLVDESDETTLDEPITETVTLEDSLEEETIQEEEKPYETDEAEEPISVFKDEKPVEEALKEPAKETFIEPETVQEKPKKRSKKAPKQETLEDSIKDSAQEDSKTISVRPIADFAEKPEPKKRNILEKTAKRRTKSHTKEDISLVLESLTGLSKEDSRLFLDTLINILSDTLAKHDKIAIHQFGTFTCSKLKARKMQVPTKDEALTEIPAHYVVRFKGSPAFYDYLNNGNDIPITPPEEVKPSVKAVKSKKQPKISITKTKDDLIDSILSKCEMTPKEANLFMETWLNVMHETLESDEKVALHQFGTFGITKHKEKKMIIPNTQEEKIVPAHNVIKFKPSKAFTDQLNTEKK
jgi:DNA-binding protein HU-beta